MPYQISLSPQVKLWAILTYNLDIYKLPQELPNDFRILVALRAKFWYSEDVNKNPI